MIKSKDIRCGNFLFDNDKKAIVIVNSDIIMRIEDVENTFFEGEFPLPYRVLPLTYEWIGMFGFRSEGYEWSFNGFKIWDDEDEKFYHINSETITNFNYVHELQNYYKATSEEELILKIK